MVTVGAFTAEKGAVSGPAAYMDERGSARLQRILTGEDTVFNYWREHVAPEFVTAEQIIRVILVSLQTDYAAYLGEQEMLARQERARASQQAFLASMAAQQQRRQRRRAR